MTSCRFTGFECIDVLILRFSDFLFFFVLESMDARRAEDGEQKYRWLHCAAIQGYDDAVEVLIRDGADVNAVDECNETPIHCAAENGHVDVAKVLIQNGADVNAVDENNRTPLHFAAENGHVDVAKVLIQNGVDVHAVDKDKQTALHSAAEYGHVDVTKVLIQNGVDVNAVDKYYKKTSLHYAIPKGYTVFALLLVCFGAEIDDKAVDSSKLLGQVKERLNLLRSGKQIETSLMSNEERHLMRNLSFSLILKIQHPVAAFKVYYTIRSFITFHGIFMVKGYEHGEENIWKKKLYEHVNKFQPPPLI